MSSRYLSLTAAIALLALVGGCAFHQPVTTAYPRSVGETGQIRVVLTAPLAGTEVSANGNLLTARVHTKDITVEGVPPGEIELHVAGYTPNKAVRIEKYLTVDVRPGEISEVEIRIPNEGEGFGVSFASTTAAIIGALVGGALFFIEVFADDRNADDDPFRPGL